MATMMPVVLCPYCGYTTDAATSLEGERVPEPGDFSVCLSCGGWLRFEADLRFRRYEEGRDGGELSGENRKRLTRARGLIEQRGRIERREPVQ